MKRSRFTEDQIIGMLKEHEAGVPVAELCRKHGVSTASLHKWKAKYDGMDVGSLLPDPLAQHVHMQVEITRRLRKPHATFHDQLHSLELELPAELPSLHSISPVPKTP